jgi:hypothetical protein
MDYQTVGLRGVLSVVLVGYVVVVDVVVVAAAWAVWLGLLPPTPRLNLVGKLLM